jgi:hypothetical protein
MARIYDFPLPSKISGLQDEIGIADLKGAGYWNDADIPQDLRTRMEAGEGFFGSGATITKEDIDGISDRAWTYIATKLNLSWRTA